MFLRKKPIKDNFNKNIPKISTAPVSLKINQFTLHNFFPAFIGKGVKFEYLVNGNKISPSCLTEDRFEKLSGSEEYSVTGTCLKDIKVRKFESKTKWTERGVERFDYKEIVIDEIVEVDEGMEASNVQFSPNDQTEEFMERLWAFKRIKYMLANKNYCEDEGTVSTKIINFLTNNNCNLTS